MDIIKTVAIRHSLEFNSIFKNKEFSYEYEYWSKNTNQMFQILYEKINEKISKIDIEHEPIKLTIGRYDYFDISISDFDNYISIQSLLKLYKEIFLMINFYFAGYFNIKYELLNNDKYYITIIFTKK